MVKINKIYTKSGDDGTTALGAGGRVQKTDPRVEAYGTVDEANATVGLAIVEAQKLGGAGAAVAEALTAVQHDLFDVGADLCVPVGDRDTSEHPPLRITADQTARLETLIDEHNDGLEDLTSFVLPGGSPLSAALHLARTVTRRAERRVISLRAEQPGTTAEEPVRYLNRLSDLLFVLSRVANDNGSSDVLWKPGANR